MPVGSKWWKREKKLWRDVKRRYPSWGMKRMQAYVYGTLRKMGWIPSSQRRNTGVRASRGYKKCVIGQLTRKKWSTPKEANRAFSMARKHCRR